MFGGMLRRLGRMNSKCDRVLTVGRSSTRRKQFRNIKQNHATVCDCTCARAS